MTDFVFLKSLIGFFNDQPILVLFFLYLLLFYKDIKPINKELTNHIKTDIGDLKKGQKELKEGQIELKTKLDLLLEKK